MKRIILRCLIVGAIALPLALIYGGIQIYNRLDDAYAQWGTANMVINFMCDHNGAWPPDWDSLEPYFEKNNGGVGGWSYTKFQSRIFIDFTVNADELRKLSLQSDSVSFNVIDARSIWSPQFEGGPNEMLHGYFRDPACPGD